MKFKISYLLFLSIFIFSGNLLAQSRPGAKKVGVKKLKGGSYFIGGSVGFGSIEQSGLNQAIRTAKTLSFATTGDMTSSMEYMGVLGYKFPTYPIALLIRPSYFVQSSTGTGTGGNFNYDLTGFTVFPMFRYIALSNDFIDFYMQGGLGYAKLDGKITNGSRNVSFSGSSFGLQGSIGADFCFFPEHCLGIEGNYRYLPIVRNINSSGSAVLPDGIGQNTSGRELENSSGDDVATYLTGVTGIISYTFNF